MTAQKACIISWGRAAGHPEMSGRVLPLARRAQGFDATRCCYCCQCTCCER